MSSAEHPALAPFSPAVRGWFARTFDAPSPPQVLGWPAITRGDNTLITAPTGSGKTLAAFLWCIDELLRELGSSTSTSTSTSTLYISPLKALGYDVERNLTQPLAGARAEARRLGLPAPRVRVAVRTGDTPQSRRSAMLRKPPHILITTPESLFILLASERAREVLLPGVRHVIVDEVHALLGNKRGASLALSLERLEALCPAPPVRIGLSATVQPLALAGRFLGGHDSDGEQRPVTLVDAGQRKDMDLQVVSPVEDFTALPDASVWPEVYPRILELVRAHGTTLIFVRMRAQAERVARAVNELAEEELCIPHHSALAAGVRQELEERLKAGDLPALISTGTLELGIDVGAIDLVLQLGSPGEVSAGLQRVGRAGHLLDAESKGRLMPLYREDLVECAVVGRRMLDRELEQAAPIQGALDVVGQHVLAEVAMAPRRGDELLALFRQAAPFRALTRDTYRAVLELMAGRYPAEVARGLTAKLTWERTTDLVTPRRGARLLVVTSGGTIPDQGYYRLALPDGARLGELEEEFVYERQVGDVIAFASASWRIQEIDREKVVVTPAPGRQAVVPFWKGGHFGRDAELSEEVGRFREAMYRRVEDPDAAERWLQETHPVDPWSAHNLVEYFRRQRRGGHPVGTHRQLVVEATLDDLGDHQLVIHSIFGNRVNAPLAMALRAQLRDRLGVDPQVMSDDNALLLRLPAGEGPPPMDLLEGMDPDELERRVLDELPASPLYGAVFRHNAARFLVLGTRGVRQRNPLWLQRLRAKDLQEATAGLPDFPVRIETLRECLVDMLDMPRLARLARQVGDGEVQVVRHTSETPSAVASGVLNRFMAVYMYEYDEPRAERRIRRLQASRELLDQALGRGGLDGLLSPETSSELQARWQGEHDWTRATSPDELLATVLRLGVLPRDGLPRRVTTGDVEQWVEALVADGRLCTFSVEGAAWVCAAEDLGLVRLAHHPAPLAGADEADGLPAPEVTPAEARRLIIRRAADHLGPVDPDELAGRLGLALHDVRAAVTTLRREGRLVRGAFLEGDPRTLVCTRGNLEHIRRGTMARARQAVEAVPPARLQRLTLEKQRLLGPAPTGEAALARAVNHLGGVTLPAAALERELLAPRVADYQPRWLDDLVASGALIWTGAGKGRIRLLPGGETGAPGQPPDPPELSADAAQVKAALAGRGASFLADLRAGAGLPLGQVQAALWELVWAGLATNDRFESLRRGLALGFDPPRADPSINPLTGRPSGYARRRRRRSPHGLGRAGATPGPWSGRWSLVPPPADDGDDPDLESELRRVVERQLDRYGAVTRELVTTEPSVTWWSLYPLLCSMELCGELRRGMFIAGLGAAQFAPAGAVDRIRGESAREDQGAPVLLNACDPAFVAPALGMACPGGGSFSRRPTNHAVIQQGEVLLWAEGAGRRLWFDPELGADALAAGLTSLLGLLRRGHRAVRVEQVNGAAALESPARAALKAAGFTPDGSALEKRRLG